jgi:hypothetical protein
VVVRPVPTTREIGRFPSGTLETKLDQTSAVYYNPSFVPQLMTTGLP